MVMDQNWVDQVRSTLPELPSERVERYVGQGLDAHLAEVLSGSVSELRLVYEGAVERGAPPRPAANWVTGELTAWLRRTETDPADVILDGGQLAELVAIVEEGLVSSSAAKDVLEGVMAGEGTPREVAEARDLVQISDSTELETVVDGVLAENGEAVESYRSGEHKVIGFLVGQVMRATGGKADPKMVNQLLRERLS
jgi:aspartyl-tRNA(Asn)/glutamyl-tRNA(Gln) amidotransferase subunit B